MEVTADGDSLVSHAGSVLLGQVADKTGLTKALPRELRSIAERRGHPTLAASSAMMLADVGENATGARLSEPPRID